MFGRSTRRQKLRSQFVLVNLNLIFPLVLIFSAIMLNNSFQQIHSTAVDTMLDKSYNSQLYAMRYFARSPAADNAGYLQKIAPYLASHIADAAGLDVEIYSHSGMLASSTRSRDPDFVSDDVWDAFNSKAYMFVPSKNGVVLSFSSPIYTVDGDIAGVIRYLYSMEEQYRQLWNLAVVLGVMSLSALILTFVIGSLFAREITLPLYTLRDKVNSMKDGNLQQRIEPLDNAEMDELGSAFNLMCEHLNEYINVLDSQQQQLRQFFNNATHQLKTPLTSIIGYSQMIQLNSDNDQVCEDAFIIEEAGETLLRSIEAVLEESRCQTLWHPVRASSFSVSEMVSESVNLLKPRISKYNVKVDNRIDETTELTTDRDLVQEVVLALLDNALLHSGCTEIRLWCGQGEDGGLCLYIRDNGRGVTREDAPYIFKSFYRGTGSGANGNGLGLSVCESFMRRMGGTIHLSQRDGDGAEFVMGFPPVQTAHGKDV